MEQLLLNSTNVAGENRKPLQTGEVDLFALLQNAAEQYPNSVTGLNELPQGDLILAWAEFYTPQDIVATSRRMGRNMCNARLIDYNFQLLGGFRFNGNNATGRNWDSSTTPDKYEIFDARLDDRSVHSTPLAGNNACNCTWLLDVLMRPKRFFENPNETTTLRWRKSYDGYQLVLTSINRNRSFCEVQTISFSSDFGYIKCEFLWAQTTAVSAMG